MMLRGQFETGLLRRGMHARSCLRNVGFGRLDQPDERVAGILFDDPNEHRVDELWCLGVEPLDRDCLFNETVDVRVRQRENGARKGCLANLPSGAHSCSLWR